jgi:cbb3-type cytochrome c oxidase subunit III
MSNLSRRILIGLIPIGLIFFSAGHVQAEEKDMALMLKTIDQRLNDDGARQAAIEAGEDRALFCQYCHGSDGNSLKPEVPNLAGQNAHYLLEQIDKFATRQRDDYVMSPLAANFSLEDKVNIAIFYYSKSVKPQTVDAKRAAAGKSLFQSVCSGCHGAQGHGNQKLARLAGQQIVYVTNALKSFRNNANNPMARAESSRKSATMEGVTQNLSDEQIETVAAYVAQLP